MKATFNTLTNVKFTSLLAYHIAGLAEIESSRWTPIEASLQALEQLRRVLHELGAVLGASDENEGVIDQLRRLLQLQPRLHIFPSLLLLLCDGLMNISVTLNKSLEVELLFRRVLS